LLDRLKGSVLWGRHHVDVPVGVVDVGSNTVRVLVSEHGRTLFSEREMLRLGADIERDGAIPEEKLELAASVVATFVADARAVGAEAIEVLIASPGRQAANGAELAWVVEERSGSPTRILTSTEEAQLAFVGALSCAAVPAGRLVGVVDVGGGSAQVVVGSKKEGPVWTGSIDIGSQRLTSRMLSNDPPGAAAIAAARAEVERYLESFAPRKPRTALAVGGSARAVKRIIGGRLGPEELDEVLALVAETPTVELAERYGIGADRARTLAAGAVILSGIQQRLGTPLKVQRGGLREGALLSLAAEHALAA
jgi:exopolyphosphatase/guanosine-5'-triphosphate,3'-diphosphate pyrophosphatase